MAAREPKIQAIRARNIPAPRWQKGDEMTTTAKIEELQKSVINAINSSCLHPAVVRLVLLNVISMVEASEREVNKREKETES